MIPMLVTLEQAMAHLRLPEDQGDQADLTMKITAASGIILKYLGDDADFLESDGSVAEDADGNPQVPEDIQMAVLILVTCLYDDRDGNELLSGGLPSAVKSLLLIAGRTPTLA